MTVPGSTSPGSVGYEERELPEGPTPEEKAWNQILNFGKFIAVLSALKWFKVGMQTGKLPKLVDKYLRFFAKIIVKNPEFITYIGVAALGFDGARKQGWTFKGQVLTALSGLVAYKFAQSGNWIVGSAAAAFLTSIGLVWSGAFLPKDEYTVPYGGMKEPEPDPEKWQCVSLEIPGPIGQIFRPRICWPKFYPWYKAVRR